MKPIFLAGAGRTPIGRFGGSLQSWTAADLGTVVAKESLRRAQIRQHEMKKRRARRGLATLCISGGMGLALLVERA
jgi:acetyl-CoA acetyltransferase